MCHFKRADVEQKPLFICKNDDCSKTSGDSLLIGWTGVPVNMLCMWKGKSCLNFDSNLRPKKHFCKMPSQHCDEIGYRRTESLKLIGSSRYG